MKKLLLLIIGMILFGLYSCKGETAKEEKRAGIDSINVDSLRNVIEVNKQKSMYEFGDSDEGI